MPDKNLLNKPYSDNIIFFDTEFTSLVPKEGELLSLGMVKFTGEELYLELEYEGKNLDPWVEKKVLPALSGQKVSKDEAQKIIADFVGDAKPYLVAYVNQFDAIYWYDLFDSPKDHPAQWIPIDFASILFANGFDPGSPGKDSFLKMLGINSGDYIMHNALHDARMLKEMYFKFFEHINTI